MKKGKDCMSKKVKMTKDIVPEDFTLALAIVDLFPVLFFGGSMILIGTKLNSVLLITGAAICFWAGAAKVLWKVIVVTKKKNVWWLFVQMRIAIPIGFLVMIIAVIINIKGIYFATILTSILSVPSVVFFTLGIIGMVIMGVFASKLDSSNVKSNWIEQTTNLIAQGAIFVGILLLC